MKKVFLAIPILLLLAGIVWQAGKAYSAYKARQFWNEFLAVNSAWLTPNPPAMSYKTTYSPLTLESPYVLQTWYSPEGNVRLLSLAAYRRTDKRYADGKGALQHYEKQDFTPKLSMEERTQAQTGHPFFTALHVFAANGLPWQTSIEDSGETVILRCHGYQTGDVWFATSEDYDMELIADRQTKLPIQLKEWQEGLMGGRTVHTQFVSWLKLNGKPAPGVVRCQTDLLQRIFRFQVTNGVWIGKEMVSTSPYGPGPQTERAVISDLKIGPIPKSMFVGKEVYVPRSTRWRGTPSSRLWNTSEPTLRPSKWLDAGKTAGDSMLERFYRERDGRPGATDLPSWASDLRAAKPASR